MTSFVVTDGAEKYQFSVKANIQNVPGVTFETRPWEPGDPAERFRVPLHPFDAGLAPSKQMNPRGYARANADTSFAPHVLHPPAVNLLTFTTGTAPTHIEIFDNKVFFNCGRYIWGVDPDNHTPAQDKDFGLGKACTDLAVFNNQLVSAMGESEKLYTRPTGALGQAYTQATDNTFAVNLAKAGKYLWRSESTNKISNALTGPRTLTNWAPANNNKKYTVGSTTYSTNAIIEYGGVPVVLKPDGAYLSDNQALFYNQAPQVGGYQHTDNGKGAFVAQGALFVPTASGLLRIKLGECIPVGPETVGRPDFRFWVRGGVEFGDAIYLLCTDENTTPEQTVILKMVQVDEKKYKFYEWCRLGTTNKGYCIAASTDGAVPELYVGLGAGQAAYIKLGRSGGRVIDDSSYTFGTSMVIETGEIAPTGDPSVVTSLIGVGALLKYSNAGEQLTVSAKYDSDAYQDLFSLLRKRGL